MRRKERNCSASSTVQWNANADLRFKTQSNARVHRNEKWGGGGIVSGERKKRNFYKSLHDRCDSYRKFFKFGIGKSVGSYLALSKKRVDGDPAKKCFIMT